MKNKIIPLSFVAVLLSGCVSTGPSGPVDVQTSNPIVGNEKTVHVGDVLFDSVNCNGHDNGVGNIFEGNCFKYELSVTGILNDKVILQYHEYTKPKHQGTTASYYRMDDGWIIKDGFNKSLEYPSDIQKIHFKSHVFDIQSIDKNSIKYRRTK